MKKLLLMIIALSGVMVGNAQGLVPKNAVVHKNDLQEMPRQRMERSTTARRIGPNRTVENEHFYTIPGALYAGWTTEGSGYIYSMVELPPFANVTYENKMTDPTQATWSINGNDATEYADENHNYTTSLSPQGLFYTPAMGSTTKPVTYQWNEDNYWVITNPTKYDANTLSLALSYSQVNDDVLMMTPVDVHGTRYYNGNPYRNTLSGYGWLSSAFLFGTGSLVEVVEGDSTSTAAFGFEQTFNPLPAPLYIDAIRIDAVTYNDYGPIPAGKSVKAYIILLDEKGESPEVIGTFEATASDTVDFVDHDEYNGKTGYYGTLIYSNTEKFTDILGNQTPLPLAVPAGRPWRIQFEDMNEEGVSIGAYAIMKSEVEDQYIDNGYILFEDGRAYTFQNPLSPYISLEAQYEMISVETKDFLSAESRDDFPADKFVGWNVLRVSADGNTVSTYGLEGNESYDMGCAFVGTSIPWFDEDGLASYDVDEEQIPEWLEGIQVDPSLWDGDNLSGYNLVIPVCQPLPEGVTSRQCEIDIYGNAGIAGNNKIIIIQGDGEYVDGIAEVKATNKTSKNGHIYNLAGQRLSKPVSGQIYIKDGMKLMNK